MELTPTTTKKRFLPQNPPVLSTSSTGKIEKEALTSKTSNLVAFLCISQSLSRETFAKLQADLLDEIIQLEFNEYDK